MRLYCVPFVFLASGYLTTAGGSSGYGGGGRASSDSEYQKHLDAQQKHLDQ